AARQKSRPIATKATTSGTFTVTPVEKVVPPAKRQRVERDDSEEEAPRITGKQVSGHRFRECAGPVGKCSRSGDEFGNGRSHISATTMYSGGRKM
ncbi:unnamed protein product, partial [Ixodes pacificus]